MALLEDVGEAGRKYVITLYLDGDTQSEIANKLNDRFGVQYTRQSISYFLNHRDTEEQIKQVHEQLQAEWKEEPLVEKFSRAHYLAREAQKIRRAMASLDPTKEDYQDLSQEFRQYCKLLNREMEPFTVVHEGGEGKSPAEKFDEVYDAKILAEEAKVIEAEFGDTRIPAYSGDSS